MLKSLPMQEMHFQSMGQEHPLEKERVTHSSIFAWRIPWMEKPSMLQSMGSQRVGHNWATSLHFLPHLPPGIPWWLRGSSVYLQCWRPGFDPWIRKIPWRRAWQPTPVILPGESHGQRSPVGYSPWGHKESDMKQLSLHTQYKINSLKFGKRWNHI